MINYESGTRTFTREAVPYGTLETTGMPSLTWSLFRGTCLKCGAEIGVAMQVPPHRVEDLIPFDGISGQENAHPGITFIPHTCPSSS
jgi:hypothetical protein